MWHIHLKSRKVLTSKFWRHKNASSNLLQLQLTFWLPEHDIRKEQETVLPLPPWRELETAPLHTMASSIMNVRGDYCLCQYSGVGHLSCLWWAHCFPSDMVLSSLTPEGLQCCRGWHSALGICQNQPQDDSLSDSRWRWQTPRWHQRLIRSHTGVPRHRAGGDQLQVCSTPGYVQSLKVWQTRWASYCILKCLISHCRHVTNS